MAETVTIAALGAGGDGIATVDEARVFVPLTLPGETVEIERKGARAKAVRIVDPSPARVAPACRHFGTCGGCALQHMDRAAYLAWKRAVVEKSFALHGIDAEVAAVVPIEAGTRRRAGSSSASTGAARRRSCRSTNARCSCHRSPGGWRSSATSPPRR